VIAADLKEGEVVELYFSLPYPSAHVVAKAIIRWREGYRYGLEFTQLTASDQKAVALACDALAVLK
jgi:hypothetical protein